MCVPPPYVCVCQILQFSLFFNFLRNLMKTMNLKLAHIVGASIHYLLSVKVETKTLGCWLNSCRSHGPNNAGHKSMAGKSQKGGGQNPSPLQPHAAIYEKDYNYLISGSTHMCH